MLPRFHWSDITTVGHYLGVLLLYTGVAMFAPAFVALVFGEFYQLGVFILGIGTCILSGASLRMLRSHGLDRRRTLLLVGFSWIVIGFVASVPFICSGAYSSVFDALFESVSALTSTGVTLAVDVDSMSYAQITWHVVMTFLGAQAVITIAVCSGFFGEGSSVLAPFIKSGSGRARPHIRETWWLVLRVFGLFAAIGTVAATVICLLLGLDPIDALMNGFWLAFCAVSTGSFVPHSSGLVYYHSQALTLVLGVLMLIGALNFGFYLFLRRRYYKQVLRNSELHAYVVWLIILVVFVVSTMTQEGIYTTLSGLVQNGLMTVVSAATTCGMQTIYPEQLGNSISEGVMIWVIVAILFGACSFSTGGGIKTVRILQVIHWIRYSILIRLAPDNAMVRIKYEQFGSRSLTAVHATRAMTVFIMYLATAALGSMAFIAYGNDALSSVFEAISYVSNCGMTTYITEQGLPFPLRVVALLLMWVGRVEFISLIAAIIGIVLSLLPSNLFSNNRSRNLRTLKGLNKGGTAWRKRKGQRGDGAVSAIAIILLTIGLVLPITVPAAKADPTVFGGAEVSIEEVPDLETTALYHQEDIEGLLNATQRQDGRLVVFDGEAIGAPINANGDQVWVNLKEGKAMIGVVMSREQAQQIGQFGTYGKTGATIRVSGVYHYACAQHSGELDVHASEVDIVSDGSMQAEVADPLMYVWGFFFLLCGLGLMGVRRTLRGKPFIGWK